METKAMLFLIAASFLSCSHAVVVVGSSSESQQAALLQVSSLRGGAMMAFDTFAEVEADSEMGADLGLDLSKQEVASASGPATLAEYCASPPPGTEPKMGEGTRVKADWNDYGTMYPGTVKEKNKDGTVDIAYDDGFTEKNVNPDDIKIRKKQNKLLQFAVKVGGNPADDPACKLQEFLQKLQDKLKSMNDMISQWLSSQRAKVADEPLPKPPASVEKKPKDSKAPKGIVKAGSKEEADELDKLKTELADLDSYIKELEAQEAKYDKQIAAKGAPAAERSEAGVKTVDDLINEYMGKIAQRNSRVQELLARIEEQKAELARLGDSQISLQDVVDALTALEGDVADAIKKRNDLEKSGELDPELAVVIDGIIKSIEKLRKKVDNLVALDAKAKAAKEKAEQEQKEAEAAARKKAREEGKDEDEAAAEAAAAAKKKSSADAKKADMETMKAAAEVGQDLKDAEKGATKLDTGLHPHGDKWWRYRYEHSHIEAILMIFISCLMLMWSEIWRLLKHRTEAWSLPPGVEPLSELEEIMEETHGAIYGVWMKYLANQMLVCIFVFLTLWLIAKTSLVSLFPIIIQPTPDMRVPTTGQEYRNLALDVCTIFFFAIVFYFGLMFAVAHEMVNTISDMEKLQDEVEGKNTPRSQRRTSMVAALAAKSMGSVADSTQGFALMQKHFVQGCGAMMTHDDPELNEISRLLDDDFNNFPLADYLNTNIRMEGHELFKFGIPMWLPTIVLFIVLWSLHRFAHMGYVRIMGVSGLIVLAMIGGMGWYTKSLIRQMHADDDQVPTPCSSRSIHEKFSTETYVLGAMQFSLFFVCYGVARMICQPWMWELHFWPVMILTIVAALSAALFVFIVAPGIPSFIGAMAMPPYVDPYNLEVMKHCARSRAKTQGTKSK